MTDELPPSARALVPVGRYSSADQHPDDRHAAWREGSLLSFGRLYDTTPLAPFCVDTASTQLGPIGFSYSHMSAQRWSRTPAIARRDGVDPFMVNIRFAGDARGGSNDRTYHARAGSIGVSDFTQPQLHVSDPCFTAVLAVPRALAEQTFGDVRALNGVIIPPAAGTLLRTHALALTRALDSGLPARQAAGLGQIALDLLEVGLARAVPTRAVSRRAVATGVRLAAEAAIDRALDSPALSVDNLVRWIGVSRSTLYRAFERDGGIQAFILRRRLERIAADLRRNGRVPLVELADRWGFREVSHMSRLFRQTFGQPPGDYRAWHRLLQAQVQDNGVDLDPARPYAEWAIAS